MKSAPKCGCLLLQQRLEIMEKACRHVCPFVFDRQLMIMRSILTEKECLKKRCSSELEPLGLWGGKHVLVLCSSQERPIYYAISFGIFFCT